MWDKNKNLENQLLCLNFKNYEIAKLWTLIMTEIEITIGYAIKKLKNRIKQWDKKIPKF